MTRKIALYLICLAVLVTAIFSAVASAEIVVGVKEGDWIEYEVTCTGNVPAEHDVNGAKIEIVGVDEKKINITITSTYSDGREETTTATLNLETGQIGDSFIIPVNLSEGDTFSEQNEGNITISGIEKKTYAGTKRNVVYASTSQTMFYWDQSTGFLVEATSADPDFTMTTKAENTNMWQPQTFGIDPIFSIVLIAIVIGAVLAIFLSGKIKNRQLPSQSSEDTPVTGRGGAVEAKAQPIHATTTRTAYTRIITGTIIAHSLMVFPKKTKSSGAMKSIQKYPTIATNAKTKNRAPKDLSLNWFSRLELKA